MFFAIQCRSDTAIAAIHRLNIFELAQASAWPACFLAEPGMDGRRRIGYWIRLDS
jgi:hypothetical protein